MSICKNSLMDTAICECRECYTPAGVDDHSSQSAGSVKMTCQGCGYHGEFPASENYAGRYTCPNCYGTSLPPNTQDEG